MGDALLIVFALLALVGLGVGIYFLPARLRAPVLGLLGALLSVGAMLGTGRRRRPEPRRPRADPIAEAIHDGHVLEVERIETEAAEVIGWAEDVKTQPPAVRNRAIGKALRE